MLPKVEDVYTNDKGDKRKVMRTFVEGEATPFAKVAFQHPETKEWGDCSLEDWDKWAGKKPEIKSPAVVVRKDASVARQITVLAQAQPPIKDTKWQKLNKNK